MVNRSEADIAVTDIFSTLSRSKVVDFSNIIDYAELVKEYLESKLYDYIILGTDSSSETQGDI